MFEVQTSDQHSSIRFSLCRSRCYRSITQCVDSMSAEAFGAKLLSEVYEESLASVCAISTPPISAMGRPAQGLLGSKFFRSSFSSSRFIVCSFANEFGFSAIASIRSGSLVFSRIICGKIKQLCTYIFVTVVRDQYRANISLTKTDQGVPFGPGSRFGRARPPPEPGCACLGPSGCDP